MIRERLETLVTEALGALGIEANGIKLDRPADPSHGDYATNVALVYGKKTGVSPRELAGKLVEELLRVSAEEIAKIEIAGPGFINFFISDTTLESAVYGGATSINSSTKTGERVNIEFISTNPTGELHIGHGRSAFFGDTLARVLARAGVTVTREFYINDSRESNQIRELGKTALGRGEQYKTPELEEMMAKLNLAGHSEEEAGVLLAGAVQVANRAFIERDLGIHFDVWYSEDVELRASGANDALLALLKKHNFTYEKDGALWLKTSEYGDDEDRVIVRSGGTVPYFLSDIAYHQKKFDRGFQTVINVWGADHHGHIKRMQAVGRMLGWPKAPRLPACRLPAAAQATSVAQAGTGADQPIVFIAQLVSLKEDGVSSKMSKRAGNVILLRDLVAEFGIDVVRWFFLEKALNTQMAFDMALAREKSEKNPVFYVQYAHARLTSVIKKAHGVGIPGRITLPNSGRVILPGDDGFANLFKTPSARALAMKIAELPEVVADVAQSYAVHALTTYATALATVANAYYRDVRIVTDSGVDATALALAIRAREILAETLALLGISAPERM